MTHIALKLITRNTKKFIPTPLKVDDTCVSPHITLFSKIAYYLNRLSKPLKLTSLLSKSMSL